MKNLVELSVNELLVVEGGRGSVSGMVEVGAMTRGASAGAFVCGSASGRNYAYTTQVGFANGTRHSATSFGMSTSYAF